MALMNSILSSPGTSVRNIDRVLEDAQLKGELKLNSRKLKEFPKIASKYDLSDVVKVGMYNCCFILHLLLLVFNQILLKKKFLVFVI